MRHWVALKPVLCTDCTVSSLQTILVKELVLVYSLYSVCVQTILVKELVLVYSLYSVCTLCDPRDDSPNVLRSLLAAPSTLY